MKAKELRIGNAVECEGKIYYIDCGERIDNAENYKPIPLTEEWLLKFGFVNKRDNIYTPHKCWHEYEMFGNKHTKNITLSLQSGYHVVMARISYVHQLQNLYFALTGKELKIVS